MNTKDKLQEEVIATAKFVKSNFGLDTPINELAERINAVIFESGKPKEAPDITEDDQLTILTILVNYGFSVDIKERLFEALSACLEDPNDTTFEMFDEIAAKTNLYAGELVYYLS